MSEGFNPGLAAGANRAEYAPGVAGHVQSLELMKVKIREGRLDPRVAGWAGRALHKRGIDGRNNVGARQVVQALLDELRADTVYTPDAVGAEYIQGAAATLCLSPDLCMRRADCDDVVVALCSAVLSVGIPSQIVKEDYGRGIQSHVLVAARDERGSWFYADPSTNAAISGNSRAAKQTWIDPMEDAPIEIVGVGRPGGFGAAAPAAMPTPTTVSTEIPGNWINVPTNTVQAGLRYAVGIVAPAGWTEDDVRNYFGSPVVANLGLMSVATPSAAGQFLVDTVQAGQVVGGFTSWVMIGLARIDAVLSTTPTVSIAAVLQESPAVVQNAPAPSPVSLAIPPQPAGNTVGVGTVLVGALGFAVVGGIAWGMYNKRTRR